MPTQIQLKTVKMVEIEPESAVPSAAVGMACRLGTVLFTKATDDAPSCR